MTVVFNSMEEPDTVPREAIFLQVHKLREEQAKAKGSADRILQYLGRPNRKKTR